jgi:hypothetical protein
MLQHHIQTIDLSSAQAFVQFNSIPQDYSDLVVLMSARSSQSSRSTAITVAFNNDNNASYSFIKLIGYDSGQVYAGTGSGTPAQVPEIDVTGNSATANTFGNTSFYITNYTGATEKSVVVEQTSENNSTSAYVLGINSYRYSSANPITSIQFGLQGHNYMAGSSISLYGVRRGDDQVTKVSPVAQGGTVTTSGGYTIHTFNTSGSLIVNRPVEVDYLLVGGGGGGGSRFGGGGGAGGYRYFTSQSLIPGTSYPVVVGAGGGGAGGANVGLAGSNGVDSVFAGNNSTGGGGGAGNHNSPQLALPKDGGSGGGGGGSAAPGTYLGGLGNTPSTSPSQGNNGGSGGNIGTRWSGGGGGGSSAVGTDGNFNVTPNGQGGTGGAGTSNSITGSAVTYAAGANGGTYLGATVGTAGTTNRGNGGGGSGGESNSGAAGGSGVVIIRYLTP